MIAFMTVLALAQENPGTVIRKFADCLERRDYEGVREFAGEGVRTPTKKGFETKIDRYEEELKGHFFQALRKGPTLARLGSRVKRVELGWKYPVQEGLVSIHFTLNRTEDGWKVGSFHATLEADKEGVGAGERAKRSPGQVLRSFIQAIEKKEYEKAWGLFYLVLKKYSAEEIERWIAEEEKGCGGHWLESLKELAALGDGDKELTEIYLEADVEVESGKIKVWTKFLKEGREWKIGKLKAIPSLRATKGTVTGKVGD